MLRSRAMKELLRAVLWAPAASAWLCACALDDRQVSAALLPPAGGAGSAGLGGASLAPAPGTEPGASSSDGAVPGSETSPAMVYNGTGTASGDTPATNSAGASGAPERVSETGCVVGTESCVCLPDQSCSAGSICEAGVCLAARCGDGIVRGTEECDDGDTVDTNSCTASCTKRYNIAFVTSTTYTVASLGGVEGADAACAARATAAGLPGRFVAYVSSSTSPVEDRIGPARGWVRVDGRPFLEGINDAVAYFPPELTEFGTTVPTPVLANGGIVTEDTLPFAVGHRLNGTCNDWAVGSESSSFYGAGLASGGYGAWNGMSLGRICDSQFRLYCFQTDYVNDVSVQRAEGRLAFVSRDPWQPLGGIAAADAQCTTDALDAGLSGSFRAFLATSTAPAASRFSAAGAPWVRVDGIPIVAQAADLLTPGGKLLAPLQVTSTGSYLFNHGGWSGSASPTGLGTPESTCNDWRTLAGSAIAGRVQYSQLSELLGFDPQIECSAGFTYLYCLEQ